MAHQRDLKSVIAGFVVVFIAGTVALVWLAVVFLVVWLLKMVLLFYDNHHWYEDKKSHHHNHLTNFISFNYLIRAWVLNLN